MFVVGTSGQPRRVADYATQFTTENRISSIAAYVIGIGMLIFLYAVLHSWRNGEVAPANPWGAKTLEWQVPTPVPLENFTVLPVVTSDFYGYSENGKNGSRREAPAGEPAAEPVPVTAGAVSEPQVIDLSASEATAPAAGEEGEPR
jgi:cytochrome c oxidase subunit 1